MFEFQSRLSTTAFDEYALKVIDGDYTYVLSLTSLTYSCDAALFIHHHNPIVAKRFNLTKEQIATLLSFDNPAEFVEYFLTLCPCPPETYTNDSIAATSEVDGDTLSKSPCINCGAYTLDSYLDKNSGHCADCNEDFPIGTKFYCPYCGNKSLSADCSYCGSMCDYSLPTDDDIPQSLLTYPKGIPPSIRYECYPVNGCAQPFNLE